MPGEPSANTASELTQLLEPISPSSPSGSGEEKAGDGKGDEETKKLTGRSGLHSRA